MEKEQVISVGEAAYLKHLEEMKTEMEKQTRAAERGAAALEKVASQLEFICDKIREDRA